jgi:hypothetical protein
LSPGRITPASPVLQLRASTGPSEVFYGGIEDGGEMRRRHREAHDDR